MANIIRAGGGAGNAAHKLAYEYSSNTDNGAHTYYSDVLDTENSRSKAINYMFFVSQQYNFDGIVTLQGSSNNNAWTDIDSLKVSNGAGSKIGNKTVSYRFFRYSAYHRSGGSSYKALMCAIEQ